jgi:uncharacterized protein YjiS (DUF1127 family)
MVMSTISDAILGRDSANDILARIGRTLQRWWVAYMNWRIERLAASRLRGMSDRELKDIGVSRSQIGWAVKGQLERHPMFSRYF